jgi:hypothetical protein
LLPLRFPFLSFIQIFRGFSGYSGGGVPNFYSGYKVSCSLTSPPSPFHRRPQVILTDILDQIPLAQLDDQLVVDMPQIIRKLLPSIPTIACRSKEATAAEEEEAVIALPVLVIEAQVLRKNAKFGHQTEFKSNKLRKKSRHQLRPHRLLDMLDPNPREWVGLNPRESRSMPTKSPPLRRRNI